MDIDLEIIAPDTTPSHPAPPAQITDPGLIWALFWFGGIWLVVVLGYTREYAKIRESQYRHQHEMKPYDKP